MTKFIQEQAERMIKEASAPPTGEQLAKAIHLALDETYQDRDPVADLQLRHEIYEQLLHSDEGAAKAFFGDPEDPDEVDMHRRARLSSGENH